MKKSTKLFSLIFTLSLLGTISPSQAIVHGERVKSDSIIAQSTVALFNDTTQTFCTGTIIDPHWIITASHCLSKKWKDLSGVVNARDITLIFGEFDTSSGDGFGGFGQSSTKANFILQHPGFGGAAKVKTADRNDVALIRFDSKLPKNFKAAPMLSENDYEGIQAGTDITIAGYGMTSVNDHSTQKNLNSFVTTYQSSDDQFRVARLVPHAGKPGGNCPGDSGGPAFVDIQGQTYVWGVASTAEVSCVKMGEYGNISHYSNWVSETMEKNPAKSKK